jgi:hypothetical protein
MSHIPKEGMDATAGHVSKPKKLLATFLATFALAAGFPVQADEVSYRDLLEYPVYPQAEIEKSIEEMTELRMQELRESLKQSTFQTLKVDFSQPELHPTVTIEHVKVGLEGTVLIHTYDRWSNTWKFVGSDFSG